MEFNIYAQGKADTSAITEFIATPITFQLFADEKIFTVEGRLVELYQEYETQCWNDSMKQCFNYYRNYYVFSDSLEHENYKTPCSKHDYDLGIDGNYTGTHEEWVHVKPSFVGFIWLFI